MYRSLPARAAFLTLVAFGIPAAGQLIRPDTAVASSFFGASYVAENTIDGSGLPAVFTPADAHAEYLSSGGGNHWTTDGSQPLNEFITYGFTTPQDVGVFYVWNHQSSPPLSANTGYDVTLFDLTFLAANGTTVLATLNDIPALPDIATAQTFNFPVVEDVSFVRFDVEGVQSSPSYTGLAEVAFALPEPGAVGLLAVAVTTWGLRRRRQASRA